MDWASSEWMQDLPPAAVQKIQEFEEQLQRLQKERQQKIFKIDSLEQALQNQKLKLEEEKSESALLTREVQRLEELCKTWESKQQKIQNEVQIRDSKINHLEIQLEQLKTSLTTVHQLESDIDHKRALLESALSKNEELELSLKNRDDVNLDLQQQLSSLKSQLDAFTSTSESEQEQPESNLLKQKISEQQNIIDNLKQQLHEKDVLKMNETTTDSDRLSTVDVQVSEDNTFWGKFESQSAGDFRKTVRVKSDSLLLTPCKVPDEKVVLLEQRLKQISAEFECFRYNAEATKAQLEQKFKETEKELKDEIKQQAQSIADLDSQLRDASAKFQQELTQSCKELDMTRSQLDKVEKTKLELEEEIKQLQAQDGSKENVLKLEKSKKALEEEVESLKLQNEQMNTFIEISIKKADETPKSEPTCNEETSMLVDDLREQNLLDEKVQLIEQQLIEANTNIEIKNNALSTLEEDMLTLKTEHEKKSLLISELEKQCSDIMEQRNFLEEKVKISEQEILQAQDVISDKSMALSSIEKELMVIKKENEEKSLTITEMNNQISGLQDQAEHFKQELSEIEALLKLKTNDIEEMEKNLLNLEKGNEEKTSLYEDLEKQFEKLNCEHIHLKRDHNEKNEMLASLEEEHSSVKAALEQESIINQHLKESNTDLVLEFTTMQETLCAFEKEIRSLELELEGKNEMITCLKEQLSSASSAYEQQQMNNQHLNESNTELGLQLTTMQETVCTFEKQVCSLELELKERNEMITSLKEELISVSSAYEQQQMASKGLQKSIENLNDEIEKLQFELDEKRSIVTRQETEEKEAKEVLKKSALDNEEIKTLNIELGNQLCSQQEKLEEFEKQISMLNATIQEKSDAVLNLTEEVASLQAQLKQQVEDNEEIETLNVEFSSQLHSQQEKHEELEKQISVLNTTIQEKGNAILNFTEEVASLQAQLKQQVEDNAEIKTLNVELSSQVHSQQEKHEELEKQISVLNTAIQEKSDTILNLAEEVASIQAQLKQQVEDNEEIETLNVELNNQLCSQQEKHEELEMQISSLNATIEEKSDAILNLTEEVASLAELKQLVEHYETVDEENKNLLSEMNLKNEVICALKNEIATTKEAFQKESLANIQLIDGNVVLDSQLKTMQEKVCQLELQIQNGHSEVQEKDNVIASLNQQVEELCRTSEEQVKSLKDLQKSKEVIQNEKCLFENQIQMLERDIVNLNDEIEKIVTTLNSSEEKLSSLKEEHEKQILLNEQLQQHIEELNYKNNQFQSELDQKHVMLSEFENQNISIKKILEEQANQQKIENKKFDNLKVELEALETQVQASKSDIKKKDLTIVSLKKSIADQELTIEQQLTVNKMLKSCLSELHDELKTMEVIAQQYIDKIGILEQSVEERNDIIVTLEEEIVSIRIISEQQGADIWKLQTNNKKLLQQLHAQEQKIKILENETALLTNDLAFKNYNLCSVQEELSILKDDCEKTSLTNQQLNRSVTELGLQLRVTEEQIHSSESKLDEKNVMITNLMTELSSLTEAYEQREKHYLDLLSQHAALKKQNSELQYVIDNKNQELAIFEKEILSMNAILENELLAKCQKEAEIVDLKVENEGLKIKMQNTSVKADEVETITINYQNLKLALLKKFPMYEKEVCSLAGEELKKFVAEKSNEDCILCYESLYTENEELKSGLEEFKNICSSKDSALCSAKRELNQCMSDVENMKTLNDSHQIVVASLTEDLRMAVEMLDTKEKTVQKVTDSINLQAFMLTETESQLKSVKEELAVQKETVCTLKKDLSDAEFQFQEYNLQIEHVLCALKLAKSDLAVYYDIVQKLEERLNEKQLAFNKLSSNLTDIRQLAETNAKKFDINVCSEFKSMDEIDYLLLLMRTLDIASTKCVDELHEANRNISAKDEQSESLLNIIHKFDSALSENEADLKYICDQLNIEQNNVAVLTYSLNKSNREHEKSTIKLKEDMQVCVMEIKSMAHKLKRLKKHLRRSEQQSKKTQFSSLRLKKKMQLLHKHKIKLQKSLKLQKVAVSLNQSFCLNLLQMLAGKLKGTCSWPLEHVLFYAFSSFPDILFNYVALNATQETSSHSVALYSCNNLALVPVQKSAFVDRTSNPSHVYDGCIEVNIIENIYNVFMEIENLLSHKHEHKYLKEEATYWRLQCELFASELRESKEKLLNVQNFNSELLTTIDDLALELESLSVEKKASEKIISNKISSEDRIREEKKYLEEEIVVLEGKLKIKEEALIETNETLQQLMQDLALLKAEKESLEIQANERAEVIGKLNVQLNAKEQACFEANEAIQKLEQTILQLKDKTEDMKSTFLTQETVQNETVSELNAELEAKEQICKKLNETVFELKLNLLQMNEEHECLKSTLQLEQNETITKLTDELSIKRQECTEIKRTIEELKLSLQRMKEENESLEMKLQVQGTEQSEVIIKLTGQIETQEQTYSEISEKVLQLEQRLSQVEEEKRWLETKLETQKNEIATINEQKEAKEQACSEMSERILELEQSLSQMEETKQCLETKVQAQENEMATINDEKEAKEQACSEMSERILELEQSLIQMKETKQCLETKVQTQENEMATISDEKEAKEQACSEMSERILKLEQSLSQIEEEKRCLEINLQSQENEIAIINDQKEAKEQTCSEMSERIIELEQSLSQMEETKQGLETKVQAQENEMATINDEKEAKEQACSEMSERILKLEQSLSQIEEEKRCLETNLQTQENKIAIINDQKVAKEQACSEMSERIIKLEQSLSQMEETKQCLETKVQTQENEMATINDEKEAKEQACSEMSEIILKLEQSLNQIEDIKHGLETKLQAQENEIQAVNDQKETKEQFCTEMSEKILKLEQNLSQMEEVKRCLETKLRAQENEQNETLCRLTKKLEAEKQASLKLNEIVLAAEQNLEQVQEKKACLEMELQVLKGKQDEITLKLTEQLETKEQLYSEKCKIVQELEEALQQIKETKESLETKLETHENEKCAALNELTVELKAREQAYLKMSEAVSQLELNLQQLKEEKECLETKLQVQENEQKDIMTKLTDQLETKEGECAKLHQTVQDLERNLQETNIKNKELHQEVQHVNEGLKELQAIIAENKETLYTPAQYKSLESKAEQYREKADSLEAENLNMLKLIELTEAVIQKEMNVLSFSNISFKSLHDFPVVMNKLCEEIICHRNEVKEVKSDIDSKHETIILLEKSIKECMEKMSIDSNLLTEKIHESESLIIKLNESENQLQSCFKELKTRESEVTEWKAKHEVAEKSIGELKSKLVSIEAANAMLNSTIDEVEENLQEVFREKQQIQEKLDKIMADHATINHLLQNEDLTLKSDFQEMKQLIAKSCDSVHALSEQIHETKEQMEQLYHGTVKTLTEQSKSTINLMHEQEIPLKKNVELIENQKRSTQELQNLNNEINHALKLAEKRIVDLENDKHELLKQIKNVPGNESDIPSLNALIETLKKEILDWQAKFDDLVMTVNEDKMEVASQPAEIPSDTRSSTEDLQNNFLLQISELKSKLEIVEREKTDLDSQLSVLQFNSDQMKETEKSLRSEIDKLQNDLVLYQQKIREQNTLILKQSQSVENIKDVKRDNESLLATKSSLFEKIKKLDSELIRMESEHRSLQNDLDILKLENRSLVSENECLISVNSDLKIRVELNDNIDTNLKREQEFALENSEVTEDICMKSSKSVDKKSLNSSLDTTSVHAEAAEEISVEKKSLKEQKALLEQFFKSAIKIFNFVAFFKDDYATVRDKDVQSSATLKNPDILNDSKQGPQDSVKTDECTQRFVAELQNLSSFVGYLMEHFTLDETSEISSQNLTKGENDSIALFKQFHDCMASLHSSLQAFKSICDKPNEQLILKMQKLQTDLTKHSSDSAKIQELEDQLKKLGLEKQALEGKMSLFKNHSYRLEKCFLSLQKEHSELQEKLQKAKGDATSVQKEKGATPVQKEKGDTTPVKKESPELEQKVETLLEELEETKAKLEKYETDLFNVYAAQAETQKKYDTSRRECQTLRAHLQYLQNKQREKTDGKNVKTKTSPMAKTSADKHESPNNALCEATNKENCLPTK